VSMRQFVACDPHTEPIAPIPTWSHGTRVHNLLMVVMYLMFP
jgi:hypothetical protein